MAFQKRPCRSSENRPSARGRRRCCRHDQYHRDPVRGGARRAEEGTCKGRRRNPDSVSSVSGKGEASSRDQAETWDQLTTGTETEPRQRLARCDSDLGVCSLDHPFSQRIYKKTSETLSQAGQKASAAFSSVGSVITKKLEDVKLQAFSHSFSIRSIQHSISMPAMRNSPTFKSFEEKVENLKSKVGGTKPAGGDFGEVLNSTANASATATEPLPEQTQETL
ncbi:tumor protein D52 isoform X6 [Equus przewalskii]|uniref:Tumor protein D52 isoform X6 n=1 Tax=Equus przewalskii TaxID=9798 RepID=A0ABM4QAM5_EQUPR|nr:tumor protein D52 isoform X6 [Equus caballus]XP_023504172.1 tumor protein D52 isoform X6 [Equus caballus]XP_023504182.1 tumor protein D52 isoform X6 [Equus caballus]